MHGTLQEQLLQGCIWTSVSKARDAPSGKRVERVLTLESRALLTMDDVLAQLFNAQ